MIARPLPHHRQRGGGAVWLLVVVGLLWATNSHPASPASGPSRGSTRPPVGLTFTDDAGCRPAGDYPSPWLDRRVRQLLAAIAKHHRVRVSCIRTGHTRYVAGTRRVSNHTVWRAVDLDQVDGRPVSRSNAPARALALWIGRGRAGVAPSEVGSPWAFGARPWFTDPGHRNHLHVGFPGPTQTGGDDR